MIYKKVGEKMENDLYLRKNLNGAHRILRILIGAALIGWSLLSFGNPWWIAFLSAMGGIQIFEGLIGY